MPQNLEVYAPSEEEMLSAAKDLIAGRCDLADRLNFLAAIARHIAQWRSPKPWDEDAVLKEASKLFRAMEAGPGCAWQIDREPRLLQ